MSLPELKSAVRTGDLDTLKALLSANQPSSDYTILGTLLWQACMYGCQEIVEFLIEEKGTDVNFIPVQKSGETDDPGFKSALMQAVESKHEAIVQKLVVDYRAKVNLKNCYGDSALILACKQGNTKSLKIMLNYFGQTAEEKEDVHSLLYGAVEQGHVEVVQSLLQQEGVMIVSKKRGTNALSIACKKGNTEMVKLLLDNGGSAHVNCFGKESELSPLMEASYGGYYKIIKLLLQHKADLNAVKNGYFPLLLTVKQNLHKTATLLAKKGENISQMHEVEEMLATNNDGPNFAKDKKGLKVIGESDDELVVLLLTNVNLQNGVGYYALLAAVEMHHYRVCKLLLENGANPDLLDNEGKSAAAILKNECIKLGLPHLNMTPIAMTEKLLLNQQGSTEGAKRQRGQNETNVVRSRKKPCINHQEGLRGIDILHKTRIEVTNSSQSFNWKEYGLKLNIPAQSLPDDIKTCKIAITVSLSGQYKFPSNTELVSPVFYLRCEPYCKFANPLSLEIEHCALPENSDKLSIARASLTQEGPPYFFERLHGGSFSKDSSCGVIELNSFSICAVVQSFCKFFKAQMVRRYWYDVFEVSLRLHAKDIHFAITWDDSAHTKRVEDYYAGIGAKTRNLKQPITFQQDKISLDIPSDEGTTSGDWIIYPEFPPIIWKTTVDHSSSIPHCVLKTKWIEDSPEAWRKIYVLGTNMENYFFTIDNLDQATVTTERSFAEVPPPSPLTERDQPAIRQYLSQLGIPELTEVGVSLGLSLTWLRKNRSSDHFLTDMVASWLRRDENVGSPSWESLCIALEECHHNGIAADIRRDKQEV